MILSSDTVVEETENSMCRQVETDRSQCSSWCQTYGSSCQNTSTTNFSGNEDFNVVLLSFNLVINSMVSRV